MLGGAYAANNSGDGNATASAKKAKKGPRGPKGATGPAGPAGLAGPQGPAGANGNDGANGSNGSNGATGNTGATGTSVNSFTEPPGLKCEEGGSKFVAGASTTYACNGANGENGSPWTLDGTLPPNATETGNYVASAEVGTGTLEGYAFDAISFNVPLKEGLDSEHVIFVSGPGHETCTGSPGNPTAPSGYLCVYLGAAFNMGFCEIFTVGFGSGTGTSGALIGCPPKKVKNEETEEMEIQPEAIALGSWAVTG